MKKILTEEIPERELAVIEKDEEYTGGLKKVPSSFIRVRPDYQKDLLERDWHIYRFDPRLSGYADRYYYKYNPDTDKCHSYISLTSAVDKLVPKGPGFYAWLKKVGERSDFIASSTASLVLPIIRSAYNRSFIIVVMTLTG